MNLNNITPLILTYNEGANIARTLDHIKWARQVVVMDSGSTDSTVQIASSFPQVVVINREFNNHTDQWNLGLRQVQSTWVLTLDADYICPKSLEDELSSLSPGAKVYYADFRYCIFGRPLRGSLYPPRAILFQVDKFQYVRDGHTQLLELNGVEPGRLKTYLMHDDRKPLSRWCQSQWQYAALEAAKLVDTPHDQLGWKDRLRKRIVFAPLLTPIYCLLLKGLILDGWRGVFYTLQRVYAEVLLALMLLDRRLRAESKKLQVKSHEGRAASEEQRAKSEMQSATSEGEGLR